jgi:RNA polymerase sigma-70 factor (ECF subfamily)
MTVTELDDGAVIDSWDLVTAVQRGDRAAFGVIYQRYARYLFRYFQSRRVDWATAEDLTSETFVRALRAIDGLSSQGKDLRSWLTVIARNLTLDYFKSGYFRCEAVTPDLLDLSPSIDGPERRVLASFELDDAIRRLAQLPGEQRECLLLRRVHGYSVDETATLMRRSAGAVRALQFRAARHLEKTTER